MRLTNTLNRRERCKPDQLPIGRMAQFAPDLEALREAHVGPPAALAHGEFGTGQHGVVGTNPSAQRRLHNQQRENCPYPGPQARIDRYRARASCDLGMTHRLHTQQGQQRKTTQQMKGHDGGKELHGDR